MQHYPFTVYDDYELKCLTHLIMFVHCQPIVHYFLSYFDVVDIWCADSPPIDFKH